MKFFEQLIFLIKIILFFIFLPVVLKAQSNQTVSSGNQTTVGTFPSGTCTYLWVNNNPSIGLPANGIGDIASFTALNSSNVPISATITATPISTGYAYIPNSTSGTVSVVNIKAGVVVATIPVSTSPSGVAVSPDGSRVYISNLNSSALSFINTATNTVVANIPVGLHPYGVAVTPDGNYVYVANSGGSTVWKVNTTTQGITNINVDQGPTGIVVSPDGSKVFSVNYNAGTVSVISTLSNTVLGTISIGSFPYFPAITPDGAKLYISHRNSNTVSVINTLTNTLQTVVNVGGGPNGIVASPDGNRIYVANTLSSTISVISTATNTVTNTIPASNPTGLSINADGSLLYATDNLGGKVLLINTANLATASTISVGTNPFSVGNFVTTGPICTGTPVTFSITVNPTVGPIVASGVPSSVSTPYGTPSSSTNFMVSGANMTAGILVTPPSGFEVSQDGINFANTITVGGSGTITATKVYIRLKQTTSVGTYSGNIVLSSAGASSVNVAMPASTVVPLTINVYVYGSKHYGDVINNFVATTSNFDFAVINAGLKNGDKVASLDISFTGGNTATDPPGAYSNVIHVANITGFTLSNYTINYQDGPLTVAPAPLTITANNVTKIFGTALTNELSSTAFTKTGLQNSETVNSIAIAYGNGAAANAAIGTYNGSVVPSAVVGSNGFLASNYAITYVPGTLSVVAPGPSITASAPLQPLTTVYGTPSSSTSFNISGLSLTAGILVTPPVGFEVSADNITFSNAVTIGSAGTVPSTPVYIRLKQTTFVGSYSGNISSKSAGAADGNQVMPASTVTPAPLLITANDVTKVYGNLLTGGSASIAFTVSGLKNAETVGTATIAYGTGGGATANVGNYNASVTPSGITGGTFTANNYNTTYQSGSITVTPAPLTVTADDISKLYGDVNPAFTVSYTGFVNSDGVAQIATPPIAITTATQASPVGQYPITVSGGLAANYTFTYVNGTLNVNPVPFSPITIPNTFTPNGDGINDTWNINNLNTYPKTTVEILNRFGTRIYFSNNYPTAWDGRYNGVKVPEGTYYYIITGVNNRPLTGYVAVIR